MGAQDLTDAQRAAIDRMTTQIDEDDLYGLFVVPQEADAAEIQQAYYALSRQWHPDRFFRKDVGDYAERLEFVFVGITQAYKTLTDPTRRKLYDRERRERQRGHASTSPARSHSAAARAAAAVEAAQAQAEAPAARPKREGPSIRDRLASNARDRGQAQPMTDRLRTKVSETVREQRGEQLRKARVFYEAGRQDYEAGRVVKAAGTLELALQYDPKNLEYQALMAKVKNEARQVRVLTLISQGEQAESYQQGKQALHFYREAVELEPTEGRVYFRLARLVRTEETNDREALALLRKAVLKSPNVIEYRMALGELYKELGLKLNARREFQAVLALDKGHDAAKAALKEV